MGGRAGRWGAAMSDPTEIHIDPEQYRADCHAAEDDWREARKMLRALGWEMDEAEEERKSAERLKMLDENIDRLKGPT